MTSTRHLPPRRTGFTIIELMIAMTLGTLLLAGAFVMHAAMSKQSVRQQEIGDMQQALRVAAEVMAQSIRGAGAGMNGGTMNIAPQASATENPCIPTNYYPVEFSNSNVYKDARTLGGDFSTVAGAVDTDPDWIRIVAVDTNPRADGTPFVTDGEGFNAGDGSLQVPNITLFPGASLMYIYNGCVPGGATPCQPQLCVRQVTGTSAPLPSTLGPLAPDNRVGLLHANNCYNPAGEVPGTAGSCLGTISSGNVSVTTPTYVFRGDTSVVFQIQTSAGASGTAATTPRLMASYTTPGAPPNWQVLAENIEDLQVALILSDGTVCGRTANSVDGPNPVTGGCGAFDKNGTGVFVRAVRFTLTARSSTVVSGFNQGATGGFEDEGAPVVTNDGFLRRSMTSEVQLRSAGLP